ncbi:unnamed protein product [Coregonus sp. 'balchen']|nr:unnamed protein product [Coregonus sp. 'balchen']
MRDFLTLFARDQGMAKDAPLQEFSEILQKDNISTGEDQLPSTQLSRVPTTALKRCSQQPVNIFNTEVSKVGSKSSAVASSSGVPGGWLVCEWCCHTSVISLFPSPPQPFRT